jgi:epoxyqueuosine reductase
MTCVLISKEFYQEHISVFKFDPYEILPEANSMIVVAVPQPQIRVTFNWHKKMVSLIVPPTYLFWEETGKKVEDILAGILAPMGYSVKRSGLPIKLLAAYCGLVKYGKNNISYVSGMGSFHRLVAFYSNLPCEEDNWQNPQIMERCEKCTACIRKCPTGAISSERFLLRAERCITFLNEKPGHIPFPNWLDPSWHNCLIGCLHCQKACPENKEFLHRIDQGAEFSEEETNLFLKGTPLNQLPAPTIDKLRQHDMIDFIDLFPRNLGVFLKAIH